MTNHLWVYFLYLCDKTSERKIESSVWVCGWIDWWKDGCIGVWVHVKQLKFLKYNNTLIKPCSDAY